jgi:protoporphyrinogen oxidase
MGGHTVYNSYANTLEFIKENKIRKSVQKRNKLPFLFVDKHSHIKSIFKNINLFSAAFYYIKNRNIDKRDLSVSQYSSKVFGKKNHAKTFKYCFDAVLSQDSSKFPMRYLFKKYPRDKSFPRSFTFTQGLSTFFKNSANLNVVKDQVISIKKTNNNTWNVKTKNTTYTATNICIATPWNITETLLNDILPNISQHKNRPTMSKLLSVAIVVNKKSIDALSDISGLIGKEQFFYSAISRDIVKHDNLRALVFHCKNDKQTEQEIVSKISDLLSLDKNDILYVTSKYNILPCYNTNHENFISDLDLELSNYNNLYVTGNYIDRIAIENCIKRSVKEVNRLKSNNI